MKKLPQLGWRALLGTAAGLLLLGCGDRKDDWYDYSTDVERRKKEYMSVQMGFGGMSEQEASRAWGLYYSIELTHKSAPAVREGEDMGQAIEIPQP